MGTKGFFQFKIMFQLAISDSFEYLCYRSTKKTIFLHLLCGDRFYSSESDDYGRQILMPKVDPRTVRLNVVFNPFNAEIYLTKDQKLKYFFQFEIIVNMINVLVSSFASF